MAAGWITISPPGGACARGKVAPKTRRYWIRFIPPPKARAAFVANGMPAPTFTGHGLVLVCDDEETIRAVARRVFQKAGFTVLTAADGKEAVRVFREHASELRSVLLDMTMPGLSGEQVFHEMRRINPGVKVLLSSGYNEQDATSHFVGKGLAGFIQKPWSPNELLKAMQTALALSEQGR